MIFIVNPENRRLFAAEIEEMHRQRKRVFVDVSGWRVPVIGDMEMDRYDRPDTTYLIAKNHPDGAVLASVRLLPTVTAHMMTDLFAAACEEAAPRGPNVWEISRFCAMPPRGSGRTRVDLLWESICGVMETALLFGIEQTIFVASAALLPLVLNCGWDARTLGPTLQDGADEITAVAVRITPEGLREVRRRFGIEGPVTRFLTPTARIAA